MKYKLGAHLSSAGGHKNALNSLIEKGGNCLQIFSSSPRAWKPAQISSELVEEFRKLKNELKIDPIYFHALYLINLADPAETGEKSIKALVSELRLAPQMGVLGSIVHTGSFKKDELRITNYELIKDTKEYKTLIGNIKNVLENTPDNSLLILENAGNRKIGQSIEQLSSILESINNRRLKVCLDTCHLHAAGYDLRSKENFEIFLNRFDSIIGLNNLEVVHLNDSRDQFGSLRDRHDNIGEGNVGLDVFRNFLNNPRTKHLPFIIETPGFDNKGPDKKNLDILKSLYIK